MALLGSTSPFTLYHGYTLLYLTLQHCTIALLGCTCLYYTLSLFTLGSTCIDYPITWPFLGLPWLSILYHGSTLLYFTLLQSTMSLLGSSSCYTLPWHYLALLDSTTLYHDYTWLYYTLLWLYVAVLVCTTYSLYHCSTWLYLSLLGSTEPHLTPLYHSVAQLYSTLLDSTWLYYTLTWF